MTLVMNQLLDSKLTETGKEEEKDNESTEKQEEYSLVLWDCVSMFDTEEEYFLKQEDGLRNQCDYKKPEFVKRR